MIINRIYCRSLQGVNQDKIKIKKLLKKDINTKKPKKKLQYIADIARFLTLLFLTKGLSSKSEISLSPIT